jgi:hypothetical protein
VHLRFEKGPRSQNIGVEGGQHIVLEEFHPSTPKQLNESEAIVTLLELAAAVKEYGLKEVSEKSVLNEGQGKESVEYPDGPENQVYWQYGPTLL